LRVLFGAHVLQDYLPHQFCLRLDGHLMWLFIAGNFMIALSYFVIPACLLALLLAFSTSEVLRAQLRHRMYIVLSTPANFLIAVKQIEWLLGLFAAFIFLCGWTHILDIITLYVPVYWQQGVVLLLTGIVSLTTAAVLLVTVFRVVLNGRSWKS
jgi:hypothetical protein